MRKVVFAVISLASCLAQAQMMINFEWARENQCSAKSPAISVSSIPNSAVSLVAKLVDNDMSTFAHGGGSVQISNVSEFVIPAGALVAAYRGPCPPNFSSFGHDYVFTVRALDGIGKEIGVASQTKTFSSAKVPK